MVGNLASANGATIIYDAFGRMVENGNGGNEFAYAPGGTYLLGSMQGQVLLGAFIPLPGGAIALYNTGGLAQYNHADWLGSARLFSNASRVAIPAMSDAPFGEGYAGGQGYVQFTSNGNAFTVYDTENQSGSLTDFTYRRYSPVQGRWIAPDPAGLAAVDPTNPQTWNRYAYVANNPLSFVDPLGLQIQGPQNSNCQSSANGWSISCGPCWGDMLCGGGGSGGGWFWTYNSGYLQLYGTSDDMYSEWVPGSYSLTYIPGGGQSGPPANNCQAPFLCNPVHQIGPPQQYRPAKQPSKLSNYVAFLGCEYNSVVETITDEEDGQGWTAYGFINAGAIISLRSGIGATPVGLVFVATAGAMDVGAMAKANKECTEQIYH